MNFFSFLGFLFISILLQNVSASINKLESTPWTVKLFVGQPLHNFKFEPSDENFSNKVEYQPNTGVAEGIGISYGWLGVSYVTKINNEKVTDDKGLTTYNDYRFNFFFKGIYYSLRYLQYQGFFIKNSTEVDPTLPSTTPFIVRRDMKANDYGIGALWVIDQSKYSLPSLVDQTQRQESPGGSWIVSLTSSHTRLSADTPFIPTSTQSNFGTDATLISGEFTSLSIAAGYGYSYNFGKKFYINGLILAGGGLQLRKFTNSSGVEKESTGFAEKADLRLGFGYNGDTFFIGLQTSLDFTTLRTDSIKIQSQVPSGDIFIGAHF